jgi:dehydrogenase/reductase SDR family protein 12
MLFGQFAALSQFYLYGRSKCTKTGWQKAFEKYPKPDELDAIDLTNRVYIVTGANSGIGFETAYFLAGHNATVYMVCRNAERAEAAKTKIKSSTSNENNVFVLLGDCSLQSDVKRIWQEFLEHRFFEGGDAGTSRLDGILCNAGSLSNDMTVTSEGIETTFAAHLLFGSYLLVSLAMDTLLATPDSRVIAVSSGGMYNTKFPSWEVATNRLGPEKYDGQLAYAYAKRGQVLLCEQWAEKYPAVKFASCHPGL